MVPATETCSGIRLVIADIDGTLVTTQKLLTPRSIEAVWSLGEANIIFGVTTGRPPAGVKMLIPPLPALRFIAGFNGGVVVNRDFLMFKENLLDSSTAQEAVQIVLECGLDAWLYTDKDWFVRDPQAYRVDRETKTVQFAPTVVSSFDGRFNNVTKIVGISQNYDAVAHCEQAVQDRFGTRVSASRSQPYYLDVTNPLANKGEVVTIAAQFFKVPLSQIATIGDMTNDITMFRKSGMSIAMGNATSEVRKAATHVTSSNDEEGFAAAVDNFILPQEGLSAA